MNLFLKTIKNIFLIIPQNKVNQLYITCFLLFIQSIIEVLGLGAILPVFLVILEPDILQKYNWANFLFTKLNLSDTNDLIIILTISLLIFFSFKNLVSVLITKKRTSFALSIYKNISLNIFEDYYKRDYQSSKTNDIAELWRNLNQSVYWFSLGILVPSLTIINEFIIFMLIITFLFFYNFNAIIILTFTAIPVIYLVTIWINKKTIVLGQRKKEIDTILLKNYYETIQSYVDIIITGSQKFFSNKIKKNIKKQINADVKFAFMNDLPIRTTETSLVLTITIIIFYCILTNMNNTDFLSLLGVIGLAGYRLAPTITRISTNLKNIAANSWTTDIILENMNNMISETKKSPNETIHFNKSIILDDISFSYDDQEKFTFENLYLEINKGETIGIIGESGSGKTTLLNILLGFLKQTKGKILIDGHELKHSQIADYRSKISYVNQNLFMIDDSIARNVAFGLSDDLIDHKKLKYALKLANLWKYVKSSKLGINTKVGENGYKLSGGQRQRIGIARAIYFDSEILFFDEATSSLDKETEKKVTKSITELSKSNLTLIIISHNEASLKYCNRVINIKDCQKKQAST